MELRFTQVLAGGRQAQRFLDDHDGLLHEVNVGGARKEFDVGVTRLATLADEQTAHVIRAAGELESERRIARDLRRVNIRPVVRVARLKVPAAAQLTAVQLPPIRSNNTDLATRARAMAQPWRRIRLCFTKAGCLQTSSRGLRQGLPRLRRQ